MKRRGAPQKRGVASLIYFVAAEYGRIRLGSRRAIFRAVVCV